MGGLGPLLFDMILMRTFQAPYVYHEYPKWVKRHDGSSVLVKNEDEEANAVGIMSKIERDSDDERQMLLSEAKELGLKVHPATKTDKLRDKIAAAKE